MQIRKSGKPLHLHRSLQDNCYWTDGKKLPHELGKRYLPADGPSNALVHVRERLPKLLRQGEGARVWNVDGSSCFDYLILQRNSNSSRHVAAFK